MTPKEVYYKCHYEVKRIPELENIIAIDPFYSYWYAFYVIKGPFLLCHPIIFNSEYKDGYINFLKSINYDFKEIYEQYGEWLI